MDNAAQEGGGGESSSSLEESSGGRSIVVDPITCRGQNNLSPVNYVGCPIQLPKIVVYGDPDQGSSKISRAATGEPQHFNVHSWPKNDGTGTVTAFGLLEACVVRWQRETLYCAQTKKKTGIQANMYSYGYSKLDHRNLRIMESELESCEFLVSDILGLQ